MRGKFHKLGQFAWLAGLRLRRSLPQERFPRAFHIAYLGTPSFIVREYPSEWDPPTRKHERTKHERNSAPEVALRRFAVATRVNPWPIVLPAVAGTAAGVAAWGAVHPSSQLFGATLCRTPLRTQIALTFDDGPNPAITPRLLALLERRNVRATFFLVGQFARACPELVREIAARGHTIGNHSETHANLALASPHRVVEELARCQHSVAGALDRGANGLPAWLRPPFGYRRPGLSNAARRAGLRGVVMWSLTAYDWKPQRPEQLIARLAPVAGRPARGPGGEIVLLHDGDFHQLGADRAHVIAALEHWLPRWHDGGFEFVTIDEVAGAMAGTA